MKVIRECLRCQHPLAPYGTPKEALGGRRCHLGRGLCSVCYSHLHFRGEIDTYPIVQRFTQIDPADCPICDEVNAMRECATARQICEALHMTAEAVEKHLLRHSPHLRHVIALAAREERRERKRLGVTQ